MSDLERRRDSIVRELHNLFDSAESIMSAFHQEREIVKMLKWQVERHIAHFESIDDEYWWLELARKFCHLCPGEVLSAYGSHHDRRCPDWRKPEPKKPEGLPEELVKKIRTVI